jgi:hypothetical protein
VARHIDFRGSGNATPPELLDDLKTQYPGKLEVLDDVWKNGGVEHLIGKLGNLLG